MLEKNRLLSFDHLRGISIPLIIAGHSLGQWAIDTFPERLLANIMSSGTTLFVFISGFFFHNTYYKNFNFNDFLLNKSKYVLLS